MPTSCLDLLGRIVASLFPGQPEAVCTFEVFADQHLDVPPMSKAELTRACEEVGDRRPPCPNCLHNISLKAAVGSRPEIFPKTYNNFLLEGVFPRHCKSQKWVLLPKANKLPANPSFYRPICLPVTEETILEKITRTG